MAYSETALLFTFTFEIKGIKENLWPSTRKGEMAGEI
jgi:hypothetical protein